MKVPDQAGGTPWLLALFASTLLAFAATLGSYFSTWRGQADGYGFIVAVAAFGLIYRECRHLGPIAQTRSSTLWLVGGASAAWLLASIMNLSVGMQVLLPLVSLAWVAATLGAAPARRLAPIVAIFSLSLPIWTPLAEPLRLVTAAMSGLMVRLLGIPARIEGDVIQITYGTFLIEDGCAGLNYLMASLTLAGLYALIWLKHKRSRIEVIAIAAGIAMVANWVRVAALITIGHATRMESSLMQHHLGFGWGIFVASLFVFFPVVRLIDRRDAGAQRLASSAGDAPAASAMDPLTPSIEPLQRPRLGRAVTATALAVLGPVLLGAANLLPTRSLDLPGIRPDGADWTVVPGADRPYLWAPDFHGTQEKESVGFARNGRTVWTDRLVFREQVQGAEMIGYPNSIAASQTIRSSRLVGAIGPERRFVNEVIVQDEERHVLVWYWYRVAGVETFSAVRAKALELVGFVRRARVAELISVSTPCAVDSCAAASELLLGFLADGSGP